MTWDSIEQLYQARTGDYFDWHPPIMAYIWSFIDLIISGPFGMLIFTMGMVWTGVLFIVYFTIGKRDGLLLTMLTWAIIFFPPSFIGLSYIVKDNLFAGFTLLLFALIFSIDRQWSGQDNTNISHTLFATFGVVLLATLAIALRFNAFFAIFPALWYLCYIVLYKIASSSIRHPAAIGAALMVTVLCSAAATKINQAITKIHTPAMLSLVVYDLSGIAIQENNIFFNWSDPQSPIPAMYRDKNITIEQLRDTFDVHDWVPLAKLFDIGKGDETRVFTYWWQSIVKHPVAYFKHRLIIFASVLGIRDQDNPYFVIPLTYSRYGTVEQSAQLIGHNYRLSAMQDVVLKGGANFLSNSWLSIPAIYFVFLIFYIMYEITVKRGVYSGLFYLALSGVLYEAALAIVAPATSMRYSQWMIFVAWCVLLSSLTQFVTDRRQSADPANA